MRNPKRESAMLHPAICRLFLKFVPRFVSRSWVKLPNRMTGALKLYLRTCIAFHSIRSFIIVFNEIIAKMM
jgi:hypothetical protein